MTDDAMYRLVKNALDVQDACNLSGVVHSFSRDLTELRRVLKLQGSESTEAVNNHPVAVLYASKISSLTNNELTGVFTEAYNWAQDYVSCQQG